MRVTLIKEIRNEKNTFRKQAKELLMFQTENTRLLINQKVEDGEALYNQVISNIEWRVDLILYGLVMSIFLPVTGIRMYVGVHFFDACPYAPLRPIFLIVSSIRVLCNYIIFVPLVCNISLKRYSTGKNVGFFREYISSDVRLHIKNMLLR
jgi:hypothetical protein